MHICTPAIYCPLIEYVSLPVYYAGESNYGQSILSDGPASSVKS